MAVMQLVQYTCLIQLGKLLSLLPLGGWCHSRLGDTGVLGDAADGSAANLSCIVVTLQHVLTSYCGVYCKISTATVVLQAVCAAMFEVLETEDNHHNHHNQ